MMQKLKEGTDMTNLHLWSFFWVSAPGYGVETQKILSNLERKTLSARLIVCK
jgi:hypothetical protein